MNNFIDVVRRGQPTAIFEDPFPLLAHGVPATSAEKQPQGGMMQMQQRPTPKGNIQPLWELLGVDFSAAQVVWQDYNPFKKFLEFPIEFVFVDTGLDANRVFDQHNADHFGSANAAVRLPRLRSEAECVTAGVRRAGQDRHQDAAPWPTTRS